MNVDSNNRIINSIDSTLIEIGPVKTTFKETYRKSGFWHVEFVFDYKGKIVDTVTGENFKSKSINLYEGKKILNNFLKANAFFIKFPENAEPKGITGYFPTRLIGASMEGTAYVHKDKPDFMVNYLENRISGRNSMIEEVLHDDVGD